MEIGERSRLTWLGVEPDPLLESDTLLNAYNRNSESALDHSSSKWFISKNAITSGLGLLGIKQGNGESETTPKTRRKRVVKIIMLSADTIYIMTQNAIQTVI